MHLTWKVVINMSDAYKELRDDLLKIAAIKDEVMAIDSDSNLTEEEKYAKLTAILFETVIHSQQ